MEIKGFLFIFSIYFQNKVTNFSAGFSFLSSYNIYLLTFDIETIYIWLFLLHIGSLLNYKQIENWKIMLMTLYI